MNCQDSVDITLTIILIMNEYEYLFNGPHRANYMILDPRKDHVVQIKDWIKQHFFSSQEAGSRIFGFDIMRKFPSISCLPAHLPGEIVYQMPQCNGMASTASKLLNYFARPDIPLFPSLQFTDFNVKYIYKPCVQRGIFPANQCLESPWFRMNVPQQTSAWDYNDTKSKLVFDTPQNTDLFYWHTVPVHRPV